MRTLNKIVIVPAVLLALATGQTAFAQPSEDAVESAKSAKDHEAIAQSYDAEAKALRAKAATHESMAKRYGGPSYSKARHSRGSMESHCKKLAASYEATAKDAEGTAADHREMAKEAGN